jgi:RND family efflux transporter MFP subunit
MSDKLRHLVLMIFILAVSSTVYADEKKEPQGMPPAKVVIAEISSGMVAPESEFIGTAKYQELSDIAPEVDGIVEKVNFDDGDRVKKGDVLVKLNSELLEKTLAATVAYYEQALSDLELAKKELDRANNLYKEQLISSQSYDETNFKVKGVEKRAAALKADMERYELELKKKSVRAPYDGIVVRKHVDRGEWLSSNAEAMTIAKDDYMVPVVNVPEKVIKFITKGLIVDVEIGGNKLNGKVVSVIPRGDLSTRTFPVKVGVKNTHSLMEGMEAKIVLPVGEKKKALLVPRDAVITVFGNTVIYTVNDSKATMISVTIVGYDGMTAGIQGQGITEGMQVIIKGNERLREGQEVEIQK